MSDAQKDVISSGSKKKKPFVLRFFSFVFSNFFSIIFISAIICYVFDSYLYHTVDCTVISAEGSSGGGGLRVSSSSQRAYVQTEECGEITFVRMQNEGFDDVYELADELNRHQGEKLRFRISYFQFRNHEARAVELEGFPIRD